MPACLTVVLHYVAVTLMVNQVQILKNTMTTRTNRKDLSRPYHFSRPPSDLQPLFFIPITISRKLEQCRETVKPCMGCVISVTMTSWASAPRFHLFGQVHKVEGIQGRCGSTTTLHQCLFCYVQHHRLEDTFVSFTGSN